MSLQITWKGKKQTVHFDKEYEKYGQDWPSYITLGQLMDRLSNSSQVPRDRMKLLSGGVIMKEPNATLASYGLSSKSKVMMLGERHLKTAVPAQQEAVDPDTILLNKLDTLVKETNEEIVPKIEQLKHSLQSKDMTFKSMEFLAIQISELLLQTLLKIDGIQSDNDMVRLKRKAVVKYVQGMMDESDSLKARVAQIKSGL